MLQLNSRSLLVDFKSCGPSVCQPIEYDQDLIVLVGFLKNRDALGLGALRWYVAQDFDLPLDGSFFWKERVSVPVEKAIWSGRVSDRASNDQEAFLARGNVPYA